MDGILLIDKPAGPTSHDVVERVRTALGTRRVGHAGTLDPPASGLLVLGVGKALKLLEFMEGHDKEYEFTVLFGRATDTDDATGRTLREADASALARGAVESALARFRGEIDQVPPRYSAVKVGGKRLHEEARKGREVAAPARKVTVHLLELHAWEPPRAEMRLVCSKGTYVRAIARDLGEALGVGACVERLRRTVSGPFRVADAAAPEGDLSAVLLPPDAGLPGLPEVRLSTEDGRRFEQGQRVQRRAPAGLVRVYVGPRFTGVGESDGSGVRPRKVLH